MNGTHATEFLPEGLVVPQTFIICDWHSDNSLWSWLVWVLPVAPRW